MDQLELLANKLQVPIEILWAAMIRQAPISATVDVILYIGVVICICFNIWFCKLCLKKTNEDKYEDRWDDEVYIAAGLWTVTSAILLICSVCLATDTIAGFINPEYWALNKILSSIN